MGADGIQTEELDKLRANDLEVYASVIGRLERLRLSDSLSEVFILDDGSHYLATTQVEVDSVYFLASFNGKYIDSLFFGTSHATIATPSYQVGEVVLKSAFAPITDRNRSVAAVLGVEANVDYFASLAALRKNLWYATGISMLGGLMLGAVFLLLQRRLNQIEQRLYMGETHSFMGRMVAVVAHEVKNPLGIIRASAERLFKKHQAEEAKYIVEETDRLNALVTGYLNFARAEQSLIATETPETYDLAEMVSTIRKHFLTRYAGQQAQWVEEAPVPALSMEGFPRALRQVILNLLVNGAEACQAAERPIKVGLDVTDRQHEVQIVVIDYGPGMTAKEAKRIFAPFYTTKQTGSGLGLYLSKRLIEEMRGKLTVDSRPGSSTRMIIHLPKKAMH